MNTNLDFNLIRTFSKDRHNRSIIKSIIETKSEFIGFSGRFSQNSYDLYIALELKFYPNSIWIVFGNGWKYKSDYIYMYDKNKQLIIEKSLDLNEFDYRQKPTKQDGKNELRKERFCEMNGDLEFQLSYPKLINDVAFFLKEIHSLTLMKMTADAIEQPLVKNTLLSIVKSEIEGSIEELSEGGSKKRLSNYYERNPRLRTKAIRIHGLNCMVCGFNFYKMYGVLGENFIEVHHLIPISTINEKQILNPKTDLACVCANCHRMLHRNGENKTIEDLKKTLL